MGRGHKLLQFAFNSQSQKFRHQVRSEKADCQDKQCGPNVKGNFMWKHEGNFHSCPSRKMDFHVQNFREHGNIYEKPAVPTRRRLQEERPDKWWKCYLKRNFETGERREAEQQLTISAWNSNTAKIV